MQQKEVFQEMENMKLNEVMKIFKEKKEKVEEKLIKLQDKVYRCGKKDGEWGYYPSDPYIIKNIVNFLSSQPYDSVAYDSTLSFCDLGSGAGILLAVLKDIFPKLTVKGFENERTLIKISKSILPENAIVYKDLMLIKEKDIKEYSILYSWEPMRDDEKLKKFFEVLAKAMNKNQLFIYIGSTYLEKSAFEKTGLTYFLNFHQFGVYKKAQ